MRQLTVLGLVLLLGFPAKAEKMVFEMSVWGIKFGEMVVTRTIENDSTEIYNVHAKGKTDFLWMQREEESKHEVRYVNGKLVSSDYVYLNKGEIEKWAKVNREGNKYRITSHEGTEMLEEPVDFSMVKLYFNPTFDKHRVFCEEDCSFSHVTPDAEAQTIKIRCEDGNRSTYHIEEGKITELEIHLAVATVKLKRIK